MSVKRTNENHLSQKILYLRNMEFIIPSIDRIDETARQFAAAAQFDDKHRNVFAFYGKMGAGKTTFIKALCDVLGVDDVVNSPTFAIVNEYHSGVLNGPVFHFDFYRIKHVDEAFDIGTDDYFYSGSPCFIFFFNDTATTEIYTLSLFHRVAGAHRTALARQCRACGHRGTA